jgi:hypothetical protein
VSQRGGGSFTIEDQIGTTGDGRCDRRQVLRTASRAAICSPEPSAAWYDVPELASLGVVSNAQR